MPIPLAFAQAKVGRRNKFVLSAQLIVPGFREPAHIKRWGKKPITVCGETAMPEKAGLGAANHVCTACWRIVEWSAHKKPVACARCGVEFLFYEEKADLCAYCAHVAVSQFGSNA